MPVPRMESPLLMLKRVVLRSLGVACAMALLSLFISSEYRSVASILPDSQDEKGGAFAAAAATLGIKAPSLGEDPGQTYPDILTSHWLSGRLVTHSFGYSYRVGLVGPWITRQETLQAYLGAHTIDRAIQDLPSIFIVRRDVKTGIVSITAETKSPELSQQIVRMALQLLEEFLGTRRNTRGKAKAMFTRQRLREVEASCDVAEEKFRQFSVQNKGYRFTQDPDVKLKGARLEADLLLRRQVVTTVTLNLEQALQQEKDTVPILGILDDGFLPQEKIRPARSVLIVLSMILAAVIFFAWEKRAGLLDRIKSLLPE